MVNTNHRLPRRFLSPGYSAACFGTSVKVGKKISQPSPIIFHTEKILIHRSRKLFPMCILFFWNLWGKESGKGEWGKKKRKLWKELMYFSDVLKLHSLSRKGIIPAQNYLVLILLEQKQSDRLQNNNKE